LIWPIILVAPIVLSILFFVQFLKRNDYTQDSKTKTVRRVIILICAVLQGIALVLNILMWIIGVIAFAVISLIYALVYSTTPGYEYINITQVIFLCIILFNNIVNIFPVICLFLYPIIAKDVV
jgi:hypothetical protein